MTGVITNWPGVIFPAWTLLFAAALGLRAGGRAVRRRLRRTGAKQ